MNDRILELKAWGCDTTGALTRMLNDEDFYMDCLEEIIQDTVFTELKTIIKTGDKQEIYKAVHTLKGVLANVGLTPMYSITAEMIEYLRQSDLSCLDEQYGRLMEQRSCLDKILNSV